MGTQAVQARHTVGAWPELPCGCGSESPPQAILGAAPSWLPLVLLPTPHPGSLLLSGLPMLALLPASAVLCHLLRLPSGAPPR